MEKQSTAVDGFLEWSSLRLWVVLHACSPSAHSAVCAPVSEGYVSCFMFLSLLQGWFAACPNPQSAGSNSRSTSSPIASASFAVSSPSVNLHNSHASPFSLVTLLLFLLAVAGFVHTFLSSILLHFYRFVLQACRLHRCRSLSPPAENRTCFIEADSHVHRIETTVLVQLDRRATSSVSNLWVAFLQHNDVAGLRNFPHG